MHPDLDKILFDEEQIRQRVKQLAAEIDRDYRGKNLMLVGILKGGIIFLSDLARSLTVPHQLDTIGAASYGNNAYSSGQVVITQEIRSDISGKDVLLIEDIYDTGRTLKKIRDEILERGAASVEVCCLLEKQKKHHIQMPVKYIGFQIPDLFVVGYGLDFAERYRHLRSIGALKKSVYRKLKT